MSLYESPKYLPAGDQALDVELGDSIDVDTNRKVHNLLLSLDKLGIPGIIDLVPSYRSLLIHYDPGRLSYVSLIEELSALLSDESRDLVQPATKIVRIPTLYGGEMGPDIMQVAEHNGLEPNDVIRIHTEPDYLVYMIGFSPGFPYLGGMSSEIATPRLGSPRTVIPAGSVGIAEMQTGVYPSETPGGWQLIGRTALKLFDPNLTKPVLIEAGDYIKFESVTEYEYETIQKEVESGTYQPIIEPFTPNYENH